MNKQRRSNGKFAAPRSPLVILFFWLVSFASIGILYLITRVLMANFAAFRSCNSNNGLAIVSCGKHSINMGDVLIIVLFLLSAALVVSLFTHAWRITRRIAP